SHLSGRRLSRGDRIVVLDDFNDFYDPALKRENVAPFLGSPHFRLVEGDIRDRDLVFGLFAEEGFDAVLHLAARAGVRPSLSQPVLYEEVNCVGTLRLLEAAVAHGGPRFLFASSSSVYGINSKLPFSEEDPIDRPISPYATTKRAGELHVFNAHHLHGLRAWCLRFFTVYGPRQRPEMAIARFIRSIEEDRPIPVYGDGTSRRDYTYIHDIVDKDEAKIAALQSGHIPIYEPGLEEIVAKNERAGRLTFTTDLKSSIERALAIFIAVGTPPNPDGSPDLTFVRQVAEAIARHMNGYKVVVTKSTVPTGTGRMIEQILRSNDGEREFSVVSNPEFLREGSAISDFLRPDRI